MVYNRCWYMTKWSLHRGGLCIPFQCTIIVDSMCPWVLLHKAPYIDILVSVLCIMTLPIVYVHLCIYTGQSDVRVESSPEDRNRGRKRQE